MDKIELFLKEDGTAEVVEHFPDGALDYGANAATWTLTANQMQSIRDILDETAADSDDLREFRVDSTL